MHLKTVFQWVALPILLISAGCAKDDSDAPASGSSGTPPVVYSITDVPVFTATIDGTTYTFKSGVGDISYHGGVYNYDNTADFYTVFTDGSDAKAAVHIGGLAVVGTDPPSDAAFTSFFTTGSWPFQPLLDFHGVDVIMYFNDLPYQCVFVPSQTGSLFTITDVQPYVDGSGIAKMKVRATFNCKISTGSSTKTISSGQVVGIFRKEN